MTDDFHLDSTRAAALAFATERQTATGVPHVVWYDPVYRCFIVKPESSSTPEGCIRCEPDPPPRNPQHNDNGHNGQRIP